MPRATMASVSNRPPLPILAHADAIQAAVRDHQRLILSAPPGTGKSTQVPQILLPETGLAVILQPRRIAARNLAVRVASERQEKVGETIGYQVRFEKARQDSTRVLFETYGVFWQQLLQEPTVPGISLVVLDEFHERSLEADACLAWLRRLQLTTRPDLALVVMSATLELAGLSELLGEPPLIEVAARAYPVDVAYQPPQPQEPVWAQAARGVRHLLAEGVEGSILVFMPGTGEIKRTAEALDPVVRKLGYPVLELSGAQTLEAQQRALSLPEREPCVIVSTNVAETSLTIPGVVAVVDSGLSRQASYDHERDMDTLHLGWISRQNATQRAGRAGRLAPGRCLRLWAKSVETSMTEAMRPEIERLDLGRLALACAALPEAPSWLTPPPDDRWRQAQERLVALDAVTESGALTRIGRKLLTYPLPPGLARVLLAAQEAGVAALCAAMIALMEAGDRRKIQDEGDLYRLGAALVREPQARQWDREVIETYRQLVRLARPSGEDQALAEAAALADSPEDRARRKTVTECWLTAYGHRLAARQEKAFMLSDGRKGLIQGHVTGTLVVALQLHEVGGSGQNRQVSIPLYLPCEPEWVGGVEESVTVCAWDPERKKVLQERHFRVGGLTVRKQALPVAEWDRAQAEQLLVEKLVSGEETLEAHDEEVEQLVHRIRLASEAWPEMSIPRLDAEDWELLYHELCAGRMGLGEIKRDDLLNLLREYVGWEAMMRIDRAAPRSYKLPGGRQARITYFEGAPPELSARLGDMIGMQGTMKLYEGRVPVLFDILAPNFRTVQKTFDLTSFWQNTYPEVKKELKRRYPKHPWP